MLKKLAAAMLLVGLVLPYSCEARPIATLWHWDSIGEPLLLGVPVLLALAYALHTLLPAIARFHERHAGTLHTALLVIFVGLAIGYAYSAITDDWDQRFIPVIGVALGAGLVYWVQRHGTKAQRLPLLMLASVGMPAVSYFFSEISRLKVGGWLFTMGYALALAVEVMTLRGRARAVS